MYVNLPLIADNMFLYAENARFYHPTKPAWSEISPVTVNNSGLKQTFI